MIHSIALAVREFVAQLVQLLPWQTETKADGRSVYSSYEEYENIIKTLAR